MSSITDINPKLPEIREKLAKIPGLKPRKLYDCNSIPAPLSNVPRYRASSTAIWKQIADYVRAIVNKTTSLPKPVINTYVQDLLNLAMHAQHSLAAAYAHRDNLVKQLRLYKKAKTLLADSLTNIKTLYHAGFFNSKTASTMLSYGMPAVESLDKIIESRLKIINNQYNINNTIE